MKKIVYIASIALFALTLSSCNKILDKAPLDQFSDSNYWTSEKNVQMFVNKFYNEFSGYSSSYFDDLNDNQAVTGVRTWTFVNVPSSSTLYNSAYTALREANLVIARVPNIENMDEAAKNHWIGVARLYRAMQHYKLVRAFGDVIYVDKVLDVNDGDIIYGPRTDRDVVMDKVLEDLNFAVDNIKASSSRVEFNQAVAQAIKSEICLYEGTFCKYRVAADGQKAPDPTRAEKFLKEAKSAAQAIMTNNNYELNDSYRANYNSLDLAGNKEMILYKHYVYGTMGHSLVDYLCTTTEIRGMNKDAFDSYLFLDGKPKATTTKDKTDHPVYIAATRTLDISAMLAVRDKRLAQTIDPYLIYMGNGHERYGSALPTTSSSGYGILKFDTDKMSVVERTTGGSNYTDAPIYWLANIYLNYAEACAELGSCTQTDLDNSVNKLRTRAGLPKLTPTPDADPDNDMNVSNLIWEVRRERRVELMFDQNDRYWSLIRWHQLNKLDTSTNPDITLGAYLKDDAGYATAGSKPALNADGYIDSKSGGVRNYDKKYYLYPIPSGQRDLNEDLGQNHGW